MHIDRLCLLRRFRVILLKQHNVYGQIEMPVSHASLLLCSFNTFKQVPMLTSFFPFSFFSSLSKGSVARLDFLPI